MRRLVISVAMAAVLGLAGCGGGGDDEDAAPTAAFCELAETYAERFSALLPAAGDPARLREATADAETAISQAEASAPAAIRGDVGIVATTAREVVAALERNDFVVARTPEVVKLQEPRFQDAVANLNRYTQANCGAD